MAELYRAKKGVPSDALDDKERDGSTTGLTKKRPIRKVSRVIKNPLLKYALTSC